MVVQRGDRTLAVTAARLPEQAGIVWTIRDVSERARLERLKSEFVATASHELRSPLTSIKGFVELLVAGDDLAPRQREFLQIVLVSTNRLVDLVNDLLDVARVEAGRLELHRRPTDLREVVQEVTTLLGPRLLDKHQRLDVDLPDDLPRALVDPARMRQILTNLLTNAHLYTGEAGVITVSATGDAGSVLIAITDTGRGMTPRGARAGLRALRACRRRRPHPRLRPGALDRQEPRGSARRRGGRRERVRRRDDVHGPASRRA